VIPAGKKKNTALKRDEGAVSDAKAGSKSSTKAGGRFSTNTRTASAPETKASSVTQNRAGAGVKPKHNGTFKAKAGSGSKGPIKSYDPDSEGEEGSCMSDH